MMISQEIPNLGGYLMTEDRKVISPYGKDYVKYVGSNEVMIWVFQGWRNYNIDYLYKITFD